MRFNCGLTPETKDRLLREKAERAHAELSEWHPFFCLLPHRIADNDCRWLETVERRLSPSTPVAAIWLRMIGIHLYAPPMEFEYRPVERRSASDT